jgi:hypothetical protein
VKFRAGTVSDFLKTKELPTKLAKFILRDLEGDPDPRGGRGLAHRER